ncbi:MAG TPA: LacI family DNA-binding transcriptional regulator [Terriglobia bacterium]|nr:LacI family DNA-binding transcriptional regulator [Terriglobia bacterium]
MTITLKDLAKSLNLSVSTVNAALHNRSDISHSTRQRVQKMAREMNYRPNLVARSLVTRRTHVLGVIVPDLSRSFFTEVTNGVDAVSSSAGYNLLLCNTGEGAAREEEGLATLAGKQVDGLIIASAYPPGSSKIQEQLTQYGIPFVFIDRFFPKVPFVGGDDVRIGYLATQHLIGQGYRNVAHLRGPNVSTALGRLKGYLTALSEHGIEPRDDYIIEAQYHEESSSLEAMRALLRVSPRPDAIFAASDPIAIGALEALRQVGLQVPQDIGIVGVGNHRYGEYLRVPLTTIDQNRQEIGQKAASLLLELVEGNATKKRQVILIEPRLIVRESSLRRDKDIYPRKSASHAAVRV